MEAKTETPAVPNEIKDIETPARHRSHIIEENGKFYKIVRQKSRYVKNDGQIIEKYYTKRREFIPRARTRTNPNKKEFIELSKNYTEADYKKIIDWAKINIINNEDLAEIKEFLDTTPEQEEKSEAEAPTEEKKDPVEDQKTGADTIQSPEPVIINKKSLKKKLKELKKEQQSIPNNKIVITKKN